MKKRKRPIITVPILPVPLVEFGPTPPDDGK